MPDSIHKTRAWVENFVIKHNLCPFAARPFQQGGIRFVLSQGQENEEIIAEVLIELQRLEDTPEIQTTLLVIDVLLADFYEYLDVFHIAEELMQEAGYGDSFQLASFHPGYLFQGSHEYDPANASNRSPYPMIHLLRCDDVERARQSHPDTLTIPQRNIRYLRERAARKKNEEPGGSP